ncbi:hypothetical protein F511_27459 [Dorcoceras hygrometricum]|uniref:Uncharacterized protein n=1 Tax=Dorcoceras hygrometricum TaxID=472368 RepID=A0A2Z7BJC5_9LAMI|nr:hypothetical protein F511_27459 [Dorcoceras hygrometricum]
MCFRTLSVIPRGSWDDVARRYTMIRWQVRNCDFGATMVVGPRLAIAPPPTSSPPLAASPHAPPHDRTCSDRRAEEIPSVTGVCPVCCGSCVLWVVSLSTGVGREFFDWCLAYEEALFGLRKDLIAKFEDFTNLVKKRKRDMMHVGVDEPWTEGSMQPTDPQSTSVQSISVQSSPRSPPPINSAPRSTPPISPLLE